jgi:hypothetical protein
MNARTSDYRQLNFYDRALLSCWSLPTCLIIERVVLRVIIGNDQWLPQVHPATLAVGGIVGVYLLYRAFQIRSELNGSAVNPAVLLMSLPIWYAISALLALPIAMLF